jgi:hypothetical protein
VTRLTLLLLAAVSSTSFAATSTAPTWAVELAAAMADADPSGDWQLVPAEPQAAKAKADILIESFRDGSVAAGYHGNITLKRGIVAAASSDGTQALLFAEDVLVCTPELGCVPLVEPASCVSPLCGGADVLVDASSVYLVVDVDRLRDGSETYTVSDILVGFENAFAGVEPDEID